MGLGHALGELRTLAGRIGDRDRGQQGARAGMHRAVVDAGGIAEFEDAPAMAVSPSRSRATVARAAPCQHGAEVGPPNRPAWWPRITLEE